MKFFDLICQGRRIKLICLNGAFVYIKIISYIGDVIMDNVKQKAFDFIDNHHEEMMSLWEKLVSIESGSLNKRGIDAVAEEIKNQLDGIGASTTIISMDKAGNMLTSLSGKVKAAPVLILGHMDTVFADGTLKNQPFIVKEGKAYGPGILDMKGGIVIALYVMKALHYAGYAVRPVKLILAGDEEVGHRNSDAAKRIIEEASGAVAAFNCETGFLDNGIVVQRKGSAVFKMDVTGIAVHAGNEPEKGRSAILEIAHKVIAIQNLTDWKKGTTFNVGVISGGTVVNAVPGQASIQIDVRYVEPDYLDHICEQIENIANKKYVPDTTTTLTQLAGFSPMKHTAENDALFEVVKKTYAELQLAAPYAKIVGGGSDSAYAVIAGVPAVCAMGVKGGKNHSPQEFAVVDTLFERAKILAACIINRDTCL